MTRNARYTRYVDDAHVLRSHATAMIPPALARLAADRAGGAAEILLVCPGITYRSDTIDRLHTGHRTSSTSGASPAANSARSSWGRCLAFSLALSFPTVRGGRSHPYTVHGRQVDVGAGEDWVEVLECGPAHPGVLARAGLDGHTGLALGMGLDRLRMLRKGTPDIRLLRSTDPRIAGQMNDLEPYRPVSNLPAVTRDLSVAMPDTADTEQIGDRVRDALGDSADLLEAVTIVAEDGYADLPAAARQRLGMDETQRNVLVRLVIRPSDRTLTDAEANRLRDRVYAAIHEGTAGE